MQELISNVPILSSQQELEQAIHRYKASDLSGTELHSLWQAIRDAALNMGFGELKGDRVIGEDSY